MEAARDNEKQIPVFKLDGRCNKMVFIRGFETVADHFHIRGIIYDGVPRPGAENEHGVQAAWDNLNRVALEKLRFYVTTRVDDIVTNGDKLTAREYYERLEGLFLQTGSESIATLHRRLAACKYTQGEEIFEWIARLDAIYTQFKAAGKEVADAEKKHRAMGLLMGIPMWGSMAQLLGTSDEVTYFRWKQQMLRKEEELDLNGFMSGQELANELYAQKSAGDVAMPATTMHQTFRGSGFSQRGRSAVQRGRTARTVLSYGGRSDTYGRGNIQMARGSSYRGNGMRAQTQHARGRGRGYTSRGVCYNCGDLGHNVAECTSPDTGVFHGYCARCGTWGHRERACGMQHAHVTTDEFDRADDGYPYHT